ncbi:hypothetical protein [Paenibacillus paeoniae]|uniref:hypothetical protein n=1 Tax=Paenibacillus paeoniae TaxID=2292705 RepID=UPI001F0C1872|nr:hypothetical protein [Paenibacillus paeoniae]
MGECSLGDGASYAAIACGIGVAAADTTFLLYSGLIYYIAIQQADENGTAVIRREAA